MLGTLTILAALFARDALGIDSGPILAPGEFRAWFDAAGDGTLSIPAEVERNAGRYRYLFVGGFHNERMPGYFAQNARQLRARGVPRRAIHFLYPSTDETIEGNSEAVRSRFLEVAREGPEELVVIAHSRGACEALAFALRDPVFVRDHIRAMFLVQGPFAGTGVVDYLVGEGPPMDGRMPLRCRILVHLLARLEKLMLARGKHGGLPELTRRGSREFWERTLGEHPDAIPLVGARTFYITSVTPPSRLRLFRRATARYVWTYFGPSDGVVARDDQSLPGLGTVLAVLDAGHSELTNRSPRARGSRRLRRALIDAIIMAVGGPRPEPPT